MPSQREVIEKAAVKAHDLREEARSVRLYGQDYHVKPPTIIDLEPAGALIEGQISRDVTLNKDSQYYYRIQVDPHGVLVKHESRMDGGGAVIAEEETHWHENEVARGLSLLGTFDDVLYRLNQTAVDSTSNWHQLKFSVGIAWAYARAAQLKAPEPIIATHILTGTMLPLQDIKIIQGIGVAEDPDQGGEATPPPT